MDQSKERKNRIIIAVCCYYQVHSTFIPEVACFMRKGAVDIILSRDLYVYHGRNRAVYWALDRDDWDYLLFVDPDMIFPADLLPIVETYTEPVVGGVYYRRNQPDYTPNVGMMPDGGPLFVPLKPEEFVPMLNKPGLYPVDMVATGCMAIRRDVLENWPKECSPMFQTLHDDVGGTILTEDVYFCWRLKQQDIPVHIDTRIACGHFDTVVMGKHTYLMNVENPVTLPKEGYAYQTPPTGSDQVTVHAGS